MSLNTMSVESLNGLIKDREDTNLISDGYHTFGELYEHRIALFITLLRVMEGMPIDGWRTRPDDGWFILGIGKEAGKQITYHLPESKWDETNFVETIRSDAFVFDGHTSSDVLERLKNL